MRPAIRHTPYRVFTFKPIPQCRPFRGTITPTQPFDNGINGGGRLPTPRPRARRLGPAVTIKPNPPSRQVAASARLSPRATTASSPCARRNEADRRIKTPSVCGTATRKSIAALAPTRRLGPARAGRAGIAPYFGRGPGVCTAPAKRGVCLRCVFVCRRARMSAYRGIQRSPFFPVSVVAVAESIRKKTILPGCPYEPGNLLFPFRIGFSKGHPEGGRVMMKV